MNEGGNARRSLEHPLVLAPALVSERANERAEATPEERHLSARERPRVGQRKPLEGLALEHRRLPLPLERIEERLDEEALFERRVPRRPFHGTLQRPPRC